MSPDKRCIFLAAVQWAVPGRIASVAVLPEQARHLLCAQPTLHACSMHPEVNNHEPGCAASGGLHAIGVQTPITSRIVSVQFCSQYVHDIAGVRMAA